MTKQQDTKWWCERCKASGIITPVESVYDVVEQLRAAHDTHSLAWLDHCVFDTAQVRVAMVPQP